MRLTKKVIENNYVVDGYISLSKEKPELWKQYWKALDHNTPVIF